MVKNERYLEISTHTGSIAFIPHFTKGKCSVFPDVAQRVEPCREHFEFALILYDTLGVIEEIRLNQRLFSQLNISSTIEIHDQKTK